MMSFGQKSDRKGVWKRGEEKKEPASGDTNSTVPVSNERRGLACYCTNVKRVFVLILHAQVGAFHLARRAKVSSGKGKVESG